MNTDQFSPQLLELLDRHGGPSAEAIHAAPDDEMQRLSPRYAEMRAQLSEPDVKRMMAGEFAPPDPVSDRAAMLESMLKMARSPDAKALLEQELQRELLIAEYRDLIDAALDGGDAMLAQKLSAQLQQLVPNLGVDLGDAESDAASIEAGGTIMGLNV